MPWSKIIPLSVRRPVRPESRLSGARLLVLLAAAMLSACFQSSTGDPEGPPDSREPGEGILEITVKRGSTVVRGATVFTDPATRVLKTDAFGKATFLGVEPGTYAISAYNTEGSGKSVAIAKADEVAYVALDFIPGATLGPAVRISQEGFEDGMSPGDTITIRVELEDEDKPGSAYTVAIASDRDGELAEGAFDARGVYTFATADLSKGDHAITVRVSESENVFTEGSLYARVNRPVRPAITGISASEAGVKVAWKAYPADDFLKYELWMRLSDDFQGIEKIAEIRSVDETAYTISPPPLLPNLPVFLRVYATDSLYADSPMDTIRQPGAAGLPIRPFHAVMHPAQDVIYAIGDSSIVYRLDVASGAVASRKLGGRPGYMAVGDNGAGVELYVPNEDGWLYVLDPQTLATVFQASCGAEVTSVDIDGAGNILLSTTSRFTANAPPNRILSRATGTMLGSAHGWEGSRIRYNHARTAAYAVSMRISPVDLVRFPVSGASLGNGTADRYHGDHPLAPELFEISRDDAYLISGAEGAIYGADAALEYKAMLPRGDMKYACYLFPAAGGKLVAGSSSHRKAVIHAVPGWTASGEVATRGYPLFLFERGGRVLSLSRVSASSKWVGIESFALP